MAWKGELGKGWGGGWGRVGEEVAEGLGRRFGKGWGGLAFYTSKTPFKQKKTLTCSRNQKTINVDNFSGLSRECVGVNFSMCCLSSWGKSETHKQKSQEISGKCRDNFVYDVFSCVYCFFFSGPDSHEYAT